MRTVLYGYGTWSHTLKEEHRLRVSGNNVLRKMFEPKKEEVTKGWRKLHEEVHTLYSSPNIRVTISKGRRRMRYVARKRQTNNKTF